METVNEGIFKKQMPIKVNLVRNASGKITYGCSCPQILPGNYNYFEDGYVCCYMLAEMRCSKPLCYLMQLLFVMFKSFGLHIYVKSVWKYECLVYMYHESQLRVT
jgi:hypothetical protein